MEEEVPELGCLYASKSNPVRKACIYLMNTAFFKHGTLFAILANCAFLALETNRPGADETDEGKATLAAECVPGATRRAFAHAVLICLRVRSRLALSASACRRPQRCFLSPTYVPCHSPLSLSAICSTPSSLPKWSSKSLLWASLLGRGRTCTTSGTCTQSKKPFAPTFCTAALMRASFSHPAELAPHLTVSQQL